MWSPEHLARELRHPICPRGDEALGRLVATIAIDRPVYSDPGNQNPSFQVPGV